MLYHLVLFSDRLREVVLVRNAWLPSLNKLLMADILFYSIMGEAENTGIIPRFAEELFTRIDSTTMEEVVCLCLHVFVSLPVCLSVCVCMHAH